MTKATVAIELISFYHDSYEGEHEAAKKALTDALASNYMITSEKIDRLAQTQANLKVYTELNQILFNLRKEDEDKQFEAVKEHLIRAMSWSFGGSTSEASNLLSTAEHKAYVGALQRLVG